MPHSSSSGVVEPDPVLDLADLAQRVRVQDDVVPVHLGLDVLGREVGAEPRQADGAGGEPLDDLGVEDQPPAHHRLALAHRVEPQHVPPGEPVLARQQPLHLEPPGEVVAGEHELRRLAGRQHAAVVLAAHPAELGQVAALGQVARRSAGRRSPGARGARARAARARARRGVSSCAAVQLGELRRRRSRTRRAVAPAAPDRSRHSPSRSRRSGLERGERVGRGRRVHA